MGQLATDLRAIVSHIKALKESVGVCDEFVVGQQKSPILNDHLELFTQDCKPMLGNPAHPQLLFDECEQMILPFQFEEGEAIAVIHFKVNEHKRTASIQYFNPKGIDLNPVYLESLIAFFIENKYEVTYQSVSALSVKRDIPEKTIVCFKAIDLVCHNIGIPTSLSDSINEKVESSVPQVKAQQSKGESVPWFAIGALLALTFGVIGLYIKYEMVSNAVMIMAGLLPTNPLLVFISCGGACLLMISMSYLLNRNDMSLATQQPANMQSIDSSHQIDLYQSVVLNAFKQFTEHQIVEGKIHKPIKRQSQP